MVEGLKGLPVVSPLVDNISHLPRNSLRCVTVIGRLWRNLSNVASLAQKYWHDVFLGVTGAAGAAAGVWGYFSQDYLCLAIGGVVTVVSVVAEVAIRVFKIAKSWSHLVKEKKAIDISLQERTSELTEVKDSLDASVKEIATLNDDYSALLQQYQTISDTLSETQTSLEEQNLQSQKQLDSLSQSNGDLEAQLKKLEKELSELRKMKEEVQKILMEFAEQNESLRQHIEDVKDLDVSEDITQLREANKSWMDAATLTAKLDDQLHRCSKPYIQKIIEQQNTFKQRLEKDLASWKTLLIDQTAADRQRIQELQAERHEGDKRLQQTQEAIEVSEGLEQQLDRLQSALDKFEEKSGKRS
ncbi:MAG: hypothetical protein ACQEP8_03085 [Chlamydiota bacterium]